jgi:hypothetical protein
LVKEEDAMGASVDAIDLEEAALCCCLERISTAFRKRGEENVIPGTNE